MKKSELITDLESKPDILNIIDANPPLVDSRGNVNQYAIPTLLSVGGNTVKVSMQHIIVVDEGLASEVAYYNGRKNFTEPKRNPLYTKQQYISGIESQPKFDGWKVLSLNIEIDGSTDILTVKGSNGTNYITQKIAVWKENDSPRFELVK